MRVSELSIADVDEAVTLNVVPAMSQLTQPEERLRVVNLLRDQLRDDVTRVHINRTDRHDVLAVALRQFADEVMNESHELIDLCRWNTVNFQ